MEGVASEAASLAGTLKLSKLIYLYDDNHISIEGETDLAFTENVRERFEAYGWNVLKVANGNDRVDIEKKIRMAQSEKETPSLIIVRTHIGYGSPKQDTAAVHGSPLGSEALLVTKENLGWPTEPSFYIPDDALNHFRQAIPKGEKLETKWRKLLDDFRREYPSVAEQVDLV
ncbi:MAG: transketolase, partial [Candidatus Aenigmarchaeota archaeon]|nr:transketolase [Candidatus Aenigmarchaeota archaeon]